MWPMQPSSGTKAGQKVPTGLDRIRADILRHFEEEISMSELARQAGYSKFHFHRLFRESFGETPRDYIRRVRLEKSACMLAADAELSVTDIAYDCGFSSSQAFTRSFKTHYGIPPTRFRADFYSRVVFLKKLKNMEGPYGKKYQLPREAGSHGMFIRIPVCRESGEGEDAFQELEVVDMPSFRVAYVRAEAYPGSKELFEAMNRLAVWAAPRGLFTGHSLLLGSIGIIPDSKGRMTYDASIKIPEGMTPDEGSGIRTRYLPKGEYGVYHGKFQTMADLTGAWKRLILGWWISSYFPRNRRPQYEIYYNNPETHPERTWIIDICLPITTLRKK